MQPLKKIIASTALAGSLLTGCADPKTPANSYVDAVEQTASNTGHHDGLKAFEEQHIPLVDGNGDAVDINSFSKRFGKNYSTMSFMFSGCASTCPQTAHELSQLALKYPNMKHIVISLFPSGDQKKYNTELTALEKDLAGHPGLNIGKNVFVLYPTDGNGEPFKGFSSSDDAKAVGEIIKKQDSLYNHGLAAAQNKLGLLAPKKDLPVDGKQRPYDFHNSGVILFDPSGKQTVTAPLGSIASTLSETIQSAGRAR